MSLAPLKNFGKNRQPRKDKRLKREKCVRVSISLPKKLFEIIEQRRGNIKRSPYICNLLASALGLDSKK